MAWGGGPIIRAYSRGATGAPVDGVGADYPRVPGQDASQPLVLERVALSTAGIKCPCGARATGHIRRCPPARCGQTGNHMET